jgi:membrane-associated tyrosine/threonine-specific cdc2-inhibitory kinase
VKKSLQPFISKTDRDRKFEEVRAFELLPRHPNILRFIQAWEEKCHLFIQTELCASSLQQYLDERPVETDMGWQLFIDILTGLDHIHEHGFIHLDIKPDNILIGLDGRYKIGDLGLMNGRNRTDSQKEYREGDNRYMAPETLQNVFTTRADVFSLGMTILSTICDIELPKNGELWQKMRSKNGLSVIAAEDLAKIPSEMKNLIREMINADQNMRPSCRDLLNNKIITTRCVTMFLQNRTRDLFRNNNADSDDREFNEETIFRERSPAITPSSANRRSSGGTASPSGRSPQMR